MSDDSFMKLVDVSLKHVGELAERSHKLAYAIHGLLGGDDPEEAAQLLADYGYTDENGEWIYGDEE